MNWYLCKLTLHDRVIEHGWMLAKTDDELIDYARAMGYAIDVQYLGRADMRSVTPRILDPEEIS